MSDDTDRVLRRLFDETKSEGADEAFVTRVTGQITRRRHVRAASQLVGGLTLLALVLSLSPVLVGATTYVALLPVLLTGHLEALFASPAGWLTSILVGVIVLCRVTVSSF